MDGCRQLLHKKFFSFLSFFFSFFNLHIMMCKHVKIHASFNIIVKNHRQVFAKSRSYNGVHFFSHW